MKLITSISGRSTQTFSPDDVRGERQPYLPQVVEHFLGRYNFIDLPNLKDAGSQGIKFGRGRLERGNESIAIEHLDVFNDGIVAICSNTADADIVLDDAINWSIETLAMRRPRVMSPRTYTSWIVVDFDEPIASVVSKFINVQSLIQRSFEDAYGQQHPFDLLRIGFNVDPRLVPQYTNTEYSIDRRGGASYAENRFFCAAPLKNEQHIAYLEKLEQILIK